MNSDLKSILEPQEVINWQGVISRKILGFNLILWLVILIAWSVFLFSAPESNTYISYLLFAVLLVSATLKFLTDYVKVFVITDKRIIIKSGLIGTDYNSIYFSQIRTTNVQVGLIDKMFAVGTINIDTGKVETVTNNKQSKTQTAYDKLSCIETPYEVYKILQNFLSNRLENIYSNRTDKQ
jgi:uncharacterized membrane protein YdbT with pleckstrin-like domain